MNAFIDDHKDRFGVEPICRTLTAHGCQIAPSTYYAAKTRPASARAVRDALLTVEIVRVFHARDLGRGLAGVRKVWRLLRRDADVVARFGPIARCTVGRLMRASGLSGVRRGKRFVTTRRDEQALRPPDLVGRDFTRGAEPAVDRGLHLRADLVGDGVHRVRVRCVLPPDRGLAHRHLDANRAAPGRVGDGAVDPGPRRALRREGPARRPHPSLG